MLSRLATQTRRQLTSAVLLLLITFLPVAFVVGSDVFGPEGSVAVAASQELAAVARTEGVFEVVISGVVQNCITGRGVAGEHVRIREIPTVSSLTGRDGSYTLKAQLALPAEYTIEINHPRFFSPRTKSTGMIQPAAQGPTQVSVHFSGADCQPPKPTPVAPPVNARILIEPPLDTNEVNEPHEITAYVEIEDYWSWTTAPDGTPVTFTLLNNTAGATFVGSNVCTTLDGTCSVTIISSTPGVVDIHAATDVAVGATVLHRETDGTAGNSGDARKIYVDARIRLAPPLDTNEVNEPHTLVAAVDINAGNGWQPAPEDTLVTFSLLENAAGATFVGDPACRTSGGTCSVVIQSAQAGSVVIQASTDVVVADLPVTRTTGTGAPNSDHARKIYVDASIRIEPDATNEVNTAHTFVITASADDGRGGGLQPIRGIRPVVTLDPQPASVTDLCATQGTDVNGQCTVTIQSDVAGTFVANARIEVLVGGVNVIRDTAGNSGPGGSGPATKRYVDANIRIEPDATNEVGVAHTFVVTVHADQGAGMQPVSSVTPVVSLNPTPDSVIDRCATEGTDANGQCTVVINANQAGTFVANASVTLQVDGLALVRDTAGNSGPGGSGPATKRYVDANIRIEPDATNEVGTAHTFVVTVQVDDGRGAGMTPALGLIPVVTIQPLPASVTDHCATTGTDSNGQCTVVIQSDEAGTFVANARITLTLEGVPLTRDTAGNSGPGGSGPATKRYVDANIRIEPDDVNQVGTPHTFTVTIRQNDGSGWSAATGVKPTVVLDPVPTSVIDHCATDGTNALGRCTIVINAEETGVFEANASVTLSLDGVTLTRDTAGNSGPGGSGPATKRYVDASIRIEPDGVNEVRTSHTFTVTVMVDDASGMQPVAGVKPQVTFSPTPISITDNCATTGTDVGGQCTVTIMADKAGVFTANARITVDVAGVSVTRTTAGNSGPGGSGPAIKRYVDASIRIEPDATNVVGEAHTFTVTVKKNDGRGWQSAVGLNPTVSLSPRPGTVTDGCATEGTDENGQCRVVINSDVAGVFVANARVTQDIDGVRVTRDTAGNSGPGGSGPAIKRYVNATIRIFPDAVNVVNQSHTFTVTVLADTGSGLQPLAGVKPTVQLTPRPAEVTDNCATLGTDADGQCTITINSKATGTFVANASIVESIDAVRIARDTDPATAVDAGPQGSGPAFKVFVDSDIRIEPSAVNEVGTAHTFTVTVRADPGSGSGMVPVPGVNPVVTIDPEPDSVIDHCATEGTDTKGRCTVVINSTVAGTFMAHATATVSVRGLNITRGTDKLTALTAGAGGSGPATKRYVDASIRIEPSAANEVRKPHTFVVTVLADKGTGDGLQPVVGVNPTVTLDPAPENVTDNCATAGTDASGQCTVIINNSTAGLFTANAQVLLTVDGVTLVRDTLDVTAPPAGPGGSGPATKRYVDASIRIEPSGVNLIMEPHTFTVTVRANDGSGWAPVQGVNPTITFDQIPDEVTNNCATAGTDANGQCTVIINSDTPGVFEANASITLPVAGVTVTRDTAGNSGPGGSGPAEKEYVEAVARIRIEPDDVNEVGVPHTFVVTVQLDDGFGGGMQPVAGVHPVVTLDPVPTAVADNCATAGTDANGQCTVVINSDSAGVFVANARATLQVGWLELTPDTAGDSGPGGSGPATKTYVDANIRIEPDATNEVGTPHAFIVTVMADAGSGMAPVAGVRPTVTLDRMPTSVTDNCAASGTDANGQCTVVVRSDETGLFTANAQIELDVQGVMLTRDTDPDTPASAGPGGSGPATKRYVDANIRIEPDGLNTVLEPHTFTVTVMMDDGLGAGMVPVVGVHPVVTVNPAPDTVTDQCATVGTDPNGQCSVVINSEQPGTFVANARIELSIDEVTLVRDTDPATSPQAGPGGSGPATKQYVQPDAAIHIEPDATNEVGKPHTFHVMVMVDDGRGGGMAPVAGAKPRVTISPMPARVTDNCATVGTNASGDCTVEIHSDVAGVFVANASVTVTVDWLNMTRDTDPATSAPAGPGGSGPATKVYVDSRIRIAPDAVNEVGTPHTFTVTVEKNEGRGWVPAPGVNPVVTLQPTPDGVTDNCATAGTDANGQCTVVIHSQVTGIFVAHARATLEVGGVTLQRDTAGNSGPGGSGPAIKRYVDANITIRPDATNVVMEPHTFTVTVKADDGTGSGMVPVAGVHPIVTFDPVPESVTDRCATVGTDASGQCTVVISSNDPGSFVANASVTLSIGGVRVTRDTAGYSGPGGSGPAVKEYVIPDASIQIGPSGRNRVRVPHTFVVTVAVDRNADGVMEPVQGVKPEVTIDPPPGEVTDRCATVGTDAAGQCEVVINSGVPGIYTANAKVTVAVDWVYLTRDTDPATSAPAGPGGSGPATKEYTLEPQPEVSIRIEGSGANEIGEPHTFTVTVEADTGTGGGMQPVAGVNPEVVINPEPEEVEDRCATVGTDANGQCTVTINSSSEGSFVANAQVTLEVGGQMLTRTTAGNSGPIGSGPATKDYTRGVVPEAWIRIEPSGTNLVGIPHTFTVTVMLDEGLGAGMQPVKGVLPVVTISPDPDEKVDRCATEGTDDQGQCTVTIRSDRAETYTANALITITRNGWSLTRDTAVNSGPGGSGPAIKEYTSTADASISIEPARTVNRFDPADLAAGEHTFVVTVKVGNGEMVPVMGVRPVVTFSPQEPASVIDTCASVGTNENGQCVVIINSDEAETFTANASITMEVNGVTLTRDTDPTTDAPAGPGGGGPAVKEYCEACRCKVGVRFQIEGVPPPARIPVTVRVLGAPNASSIVCGPTRTLSEDGWSATCMTGQATGQRTVDFLNVDCSAGVQVSVAGQDDVGRELQITPPPGRWEPCPNDEPNCVVVPADRFDMAAVTPRVDLWDWVARVIATGSIDVPQSTRQAVLMEDVSALRIRERPGTDAPVVGRLLPGQEAVILEGPQWVDETAWYRIRNLASGAIGWVSGDYLVIQPAAMRPGGTGSAAVAPAGLLAPGRSARLRSGISGLNIRSGPGTENAILGVVRPGDGLRILEGPKVVAGVNWYAISNETRKIEGWVSGEYLEGVP